VEINVDEKSAEAAMGYAKPKMLMYNGCVLYYRKSNLSGKFGT
jgi:hypothetical protein